MSPKGTQPLNVLGSQFALNPDWQALNPAAARPAQCIRGISDRAVGSDDRRIQAARAEEIHERGIDVGQAGLERFLPGTAANGKRTGRSSCPAGQSVV